MKRYLAYIFIFLVAAMAGTGLQAENRPATKSQALLECIAEGPDLGHSVMAVLAVTSDGDTIARLNSSKMLIPASNMKLVTTGIALNELRPDFRFRTRICHSGTIVDGVLKGDLYICGGGDPTLASNDSISIGVRMLFDTWQAFVSGAGIRRIEGRVIGDSRFLEGMMEDESWQLGDVGAYFATGCCGLNFYENRMDFTVVPGESEGRPLSITEKYPFTPWMSYSYECSTGAKSSKNTLLMYGSDQSTSAVFRGTYPVGGGKTNLGCSNDFPEYTCAWLFTRHLASRGIKCTADPADTRTVFKADRLVDGSSLTVIGETFSPTLDRIIYETNHKSNNVYAEAIFRMTGHTLSGRSDAESARKAAEQGLRRLGMTDLSGIQCHDGCGLSTSDFVSPDFLCSFLKKMASKPFFPCYLASLPQPGGHGTLSERMKGCDSRVTGRVYAKSGTLTGTRAFSGYILPEENGGQTIYFSIIINNCTASSARMGKAVDRLIEAFATEKGI